MRLLRHVETRGPPAQPDGDEDAPGPRLIPILAYHTVSDRPLPWIARFAITPRTFAEHLDVIVAADASTMTVSDFVDAIRQDPPALPERLVLITFDDGFADFRDEALPAMASRGIRSTLYVTTGFAEQGRGPYGDRMLDFASLEALAAAGVELGGHTHTHPQLDTLAGRHLHEEVERCKALLEDRVGTPIRTFAYPHGYSSPRVRGAVREAGYESACAIMNGLSSVPRDPFMIPRLMVRSTTSTAELGAWLRGRGAPVAPRGDRVRTRVWRAYRRGTVRLGIRPAVNL
jgi:peptidoglycan/xylan/chitin deacetylase (PgdA/CDA1 family)